MESNASRWKNTTLFKKSGSTIIAIDALPTAYPVEEFNIPICSIY
jgi:hypothetical protein